MEPTGFTPPDLTHPAEWLHAGALALQGGAWAIMAFGCLGLVLAALAFALRRGEAPNPLDGVVAGYSQILAAIPHAALAVGLVVASVAACGTLAKRAHHWEQNARADLLAAYPDYKMIQVAPIFGRSEEVVWTTKAIRDKKEVDVRQSRVDWYTHHLAGTDVKARILRKPDPVDAKKERFGVAFDGTWQLVSPLSRPSKFYVDLPVTSNAGIVSDFSLYLDDKLLSPESDGAARYWFELPANGKGALHMKYNAEGVPRWVYDTVGAKLTAFTLAIEHDLANATYASGVAPTKADSWDHGDRITWAFPGNAAISEPLGLFTTAGKLPMAGILPRWLLLAPALLAGWLAVLAIAIRPTFRGYASAGVLFGAAVLVTAAGGRMMSPIWPWLLAGLSVAFLAAALSSDKPREAQLATLFALVVPGVALAMPYAGVGLAIAGTALATWLVRQPAPVKPLA